MKTATYEHKCRRCGTVLDGRTQSLEDVVGLTTEPPIEHVECRKGSSIGVGIADCIGYRIEENQE